MFEGNAIQCTDPPRRSLAIRTVAPASKLTGLEPRSHAIWGLITVGPAMKLPGLLHGRAGND
jgi:hypothetical protein